jgi:hypothetical protein
MLGRSPAMDERRNASRQLSCIPAHIGSKEDTPHLALIHDVSSTGALLFTRAQLEVDEEVTLSLYLSPDSAPPREASGKVVRVGRRALDRADIWQWEVGVEFHEPIDEYQSEIEDLTERQRKAGVIRG